MSKVIWPYTRTSVMQGLRAGERDAWDVFVTVYVPLSHRFCKNQGLTDHDAEAIVSQLTERVQRFEYDRKKGRFSGWLMTVLSHDIARWKKKEQGSPAEFVDDDFDRSEVVGVGSDWEDELLEGILIAALKRIRNEFKERTWIAFDATWLERPRRRPDDVARELGIRRQRLSSQGDGAQATRSGS